MRLWHETFHHNNYNYYMNSHIRKLSAGGVLITLGIIFGDIGTSPLYTLQVLLKEGGRADQFMVLGALSCIFWTLTLQTTFKYILITLQADNRGEGGIFSLFALVRRYGKWLAIPAIIGAGTLLADGIITPPISVTSAIEGLGLVPSLSSIFIPGHDAVLIVVIVILVLLFFSTIWYQYSRQCFWANYVGLVCNARFVGFGSNYTLPSYI
jgi:KUP system potassium uptake protein